MRCEKGQYPWRYPTDEVKKSGPAVVLLSVRGVSGAGDLQQIFLLIPFQYLG